MLSRNTRFRCGPRTTGIARRRLHARRKAAKDIGIGERVVRQAMQRGDLPVYRFGARARLKVRDVRAWLETRREPRRWRRPRSRPPDRPASGLNLAAPRGAPTVVPLAAKPDSGGER
jgi:excisionase family DNA binding protein